ncbi:MAG TPA: tyrosine-type recombinase/integrase [Kineosporiaceae bacterium]|nr:tyrosine-type recombinase/integrase [Kineosporiaceae bacterium]
MIGDGDPERDLAVLVVPQAGRLVATGDRYEPYRLIDPDGVVVEAVASYFRDLLAAGRAESTVRSYGLALLRWFRFLWSDTGVAWDRAARVEARDFSRWLQVAGRQPRPHWRRTSTAGSVAPAGAGKAYAPSVRAHSETVLRSFYEFHRDAGTGPVINPFPLERSRRGGRAHAHHNPMEPYGNERSGLYRPRVPSRIPRSIPDEEFNEIFARLPSHRDRALVAFYVSTGARAAELLSATLAGVNPGRQLITVVRKGTRELQELPASTDAFVWLRLYQVEMDGLIPKGRRQPLWWTLRGPVRPLTYHAVHRMFERVNRQAGTSATLHALRHTAAYRMAEDATLPLTDVQFVLGHAQLTTTQIYLTPRREEVIRRVLAHHLEQTRQAAARSRPAPAPGYRPETLDVLFQNGVS